jgi:hypothetical protein
MRKEIRGKKKKEGMQRGIRTLFELDSVRVIFIKVALVVRSFLCEKERKESDERDEVTKIGVAFLLLSLT